MANDSYQQAANGLEDDLFEDDMIDEGMTPMNSSFPQGADEDNNELAAILGEGGDGGIDLDQILARDLEEGEKADDAEDYGDIGDDESLPDEESTTGGPVRPLDELPSAVSGGLVEDALLDLDDDDDLFGGDPVFSPTDHNVQQPVSPKLSRPGIVEQNGDMDGDAELASDHEDEDADETEDPEMSMEDLQQWRLQQMLFQSSGKGAAPTTLDENLDEWLKLEFPQFKRDETPYWTKLLPPRLARWNFKTPAKAPKPVRPSKVNLEIESDQKNLFNSSIAAVLEARQDIVKAELAKIVQLDEQEDEDSDSDDVLPAGLDMRDLNMICTDFDTLSHGDFSDSGLGGISPDPSKDDDVFDTDLFDESDRPVKKRRLGLDPQDIVAIRQIDMPSFDDPESMTARLARQVMLDLNDPALLVEEIDPEVARARARVDEKAESARTTKDRLKARFKTSNDAEYDLLKENHKQKVRGQLGHMTIDHALPAIRLQYPYFKVKMPLSELRSYHRKRMTFKQPITFTKLNKVKKKDRKNKSTKDLYSKTKDLSLADNSTALLLEYAEEHPVMMSQTGMGSKIVKYYRRKTTDDTYRPKPEVGETNVLLPEDKSPFQNFGPIDNGEEISALYNSMYRAPLFEHPGKTQDFLLVREHTGLEGSYHYLRNIDHTFVVGQELPSVTVPGTHSRAVTTASKNRLKAISFRIARKKKTGRIRVEDVTRHFPDTSDMQNRQKMKEFMAFNKEFKEWEMKAGEALPDEEAIQQLLKPEDICLLESMQVGHQYLQDAGYADNDDDDDNDAKDNSADSIEQQLAPWRTTKNFIQATQGKAMLKLFGDGDPSGRGEAFSFIKTSMKGGFKAVGGSVQDTIAMQKELGGHSYNVARQQKSYEDSIRAIWEKQKASLSSTIEPSDIDDEGVDGQIENYSRNRDARSTPMAGSSVVSRRRDDETATSFSKRSVGSQAQRYLKIVRTIEKDGEEYEQEDIITNPAIIKQYTRHKAAEETEKTRIEDLKPTGDADLDARQKKRLEEELIRLEKARARRNQRDKTKAALKAASLNAASPDGDASTPGTSGRQVQATQRKCANCGQVGHIKTNKKLCPLLNGTIKQDDQFNNAAFMGAPPTMP